MVCEFTYHPSNIIKSQNDIGVMQLKIPRLKKHELASIRLTPTVQLAHYNGPSKLNPPPLSAVALSLQKRLCKLIQLGQGLGHEMRHGCLMCTQKINLSSGRGSTLI